MRSCKNGNDFEREHTSINKINIFKTYWLRLVRMIVAWFWISRNPRLLLFSLSHSRGKPHTSGVWEWERLEQRAYQWYLKRQLNETFCTCTCASNNFLISFSASRSVVYHLENESEMTIAPSNDTFSLSYAFCQFPCDACRSFNWMMLENDLARVIVFFRYLITRLIWGREMGVNGLTWNGVVCEGRRRSWQLRN